MKHFSEFEKDLLKEMIVLDTKIISFDHIIKNSAKFKEKKFALREINSEGQTLTVLYIRKHIIEGPRDETIKYLAVPYEIQELYNYLLKENLVIKIDIEEEPTWKLIGYSAGVEYIENEDHTIRFNNNYTIGNDNEWRDENDVIIYESISVPKQALDASSFTTYFVLTQQLLDFVNNDFKDDDEIKFDFEKDKAEKQNLFTKLSITAAFIAALSPLFLAKFCSNSVKITEPIEIDQASTVEANIQEIRETLDGIRQGINTNSKEIDSLTQTIKEKDFKTNNNTKRK